MSLRHVRRDEVLHEELYLSAVKSKGLAIEFVPLQCITPEMAFAAIEEDPDALSFIPTEKETAEMAYRAVSEKGSTILYASKQNEHLAYLALQRDFMSLRYIVSQNIPLCIVALVRAELLKVTDEQFSQVSDMICRDSDVILKLFGHIKERYWFSCIDPFSSIGNVCYKNLTGQCYFEVKRFVYGMLVDMDGKYLSMVPEEDMDFTTCRIAVKNDPAAFELIPKKVLKKFDKENSKELYEIVTRGH